jgi:hypothetical protein
MIKNLSFTQISMFMKCGEQYRRRYVQGDRVPPGVSLIKGSAVDKSVDHNLNNKIETGQLLEPEDVATIAAETVETGFVAGVLLDDEEAKIGIRKVKGLTIDSAVLLSKLHHAKFAPVISPLRVQADWELELQGYPFGLVGKIDVIETDGTVRDTKTTAKSPSEDTAEISDQLTMYAFAMEESFERDPGRLYCLDYLVDLKVPKTVSLKARRTQAQINAFLLKVEAVSSAIEKGVFIPTDSSNWWCSAKWCGYFKSCKYRKT